MSRIATANTLGFVLPHLAGARRVLEVGCGSGELARALVGEGLEVTAIDVHLPRRATGAGVRFLEVDLLRFEDRPFDAVIAVTSLHHINPLEKAVERLAALIVPGGKLLLDEFDVEAPDQATARWFYDIQEAMVGCGYPRERIHGNASDDPLARWRAEHFHEQPLHPAAAMLTALERRFRREETGRDLYLYRYLAVALDDRAGDSVQMEEAEAVSRGAIKPVGWQLVATRL